MAINVINSTNNTQSSLHQAAELNSINRIQQLLSEGVDINEQYSQPPITPNSFTTIEELIKESVSRNPNPFTKIQRGDTPLHVATRAENTEAVQFLLKASADTAIKNETNKTVIDVLLSPLYPFNDKLASCFVARGLLPPSKAIKPTFSYEFFGKKPPLIQSAQRARQDAYGQTLDGILPTDLLKLVLNMAGESHEYLPHQTLPSASCNG